MSLENEQSPWRSQKIDEYVAEHSPPGDEYAAYRRMLQAEDDERYFILRRETHFSVTLHRAPYNNGHLLIIPHRRVTGYREMTTAEQDELARLLGVATGWLREGLGAEGINIAMNEGDFAESKEPNYLLVHVVPRWRGDTNFMTTVNDTRVIPESLEDTYERLRCHIE